MIDAYSNNNNECINNKECNFANTNSEKDSLNLITYFFNFLNSTENLNLVLCGYFYKFFNTLNNKYHLELLKYLNNNKININNIIKHCYIDSISQVISSVIEYSNNLDENLDILNEFNKFLKHCFYLIFEICDKVNYVENDLIILYNFFNMILLINNKKKIIDILIKNRNYINLLFNILHQLINNFLKSDNINNNYNTLNYTNLLIVTLLDFINLFIKELNSNILNIELKPIDINEYSRLCLTEIEYINSNVFNLNKNYSNFYNTYVGEYSLNIICLLKEALNFSLNNGTIIICSIYTFINELLIYQQSIFYKHNIHLFIYFYNTGINYIKDKIMCNILHNKVFDYIKSFLELVLKNIQLHKFVNINLDDYRNIVDSLNLTAKFVSDNINEKYKFNFENTTRININHAFIIKIGEILSYIISELNTTISNNSIYEEKLNSEISPLLNLNSNDTNHVNNYIQLYNKKLLMDKKVEEWGYDNKKKELVIDETELNNADNLANPTYEILSDNKNKTENKLNNNINFKYKEKEEDEFNWDYKTDDYCKNKNHKEINKEDNDFELFDFIDKNEVSNSNNKKNIDFDTDNFDF